jgi:hypothetical protein
MKLCGAILQIGRGITAMRSSKGSRHITVGHVEYRWRATGDDGYISIGIWPIKNGGAFIHGNLRYHETWIDNGDGSFSSAGDQIVVTNRLIRRIIEHAIIVHQYDPNVKGKELNLQVLDEVIEWHGAVRASHPGPAHSGLVSNCPSSRPNEGGETIPVFNSGRRSWIRL